MRSSCRLSSWLRSEAFSRQVVTFSPTLNSLTSWKALSLAGRGGGGDSQLSAGGSNSSYHRSSLEWPLDDEVMVPYKLELKFKCSFVHMKSTSCCMFFVQMTYQTEPHPWLLRQGKSWCAQCLPGKVSKKIKFKKFIGLLNLFIFHSMTVKDILVCSFTIDYIIYRSLLPNWGESEMFNDVHLFTCYYTWKFELFPLAFK